MPLSLPISIWILLVLFILIAIRSNRYFSPPLWQLMSAAALFSLLSKQISFIESFNAIDWNVIIYLFGVFVIASALELSHYLEFLMLKVITHAKSSYGLLALLMISTSALTLVLMNDTVAIIGTLAVLVFIKHTKLPALPFLLALAFCITVSSVTSPIGNPQNLMIALTMPTPFMSFFGTLFIPTIINLVVLYLYICLIFRQSLTPKLPVYEGSLTFDDALAQRVKWSLFILILLIIIKIILLYFSSALPLPFGAIALCATLPILTESRRISIIKRVDWFSLLFFISLFIFIKAVWLSGFFQQLFNQLGLDLKNKITITMVGLSLSQLISNVPLVALYLPFLEHQNSAQLLTLAMSSTLAGNILVLGAVSNIIIVQTAERQGQKAFSFYQFLCYGLPLTLIQTLIYLVFI